MPSPVEEREGARWAGGLQDGTLQGMAALRLLLTAGLNQGSNEALADVVREALHQLDGEIGDLRALIAEMREQ
jgi:signal transduction histidine kinase